MNINQDPIGRSDSQRPPTPAERASMEATRRHVQQANSEGRKIVAETTERSKAESRNREDRIEISVRSRRTHEAAEARHERDNRIEALRKAHKAGNLATPERVRQAADSMLKRGQRG